MYTERKSCIRKTRVSPVSGNTGKKHWGRFKRRKKKGGNGFNFRELAASLNPDLQAKLPQKQNYDEPVAFKLDEDQEAISHTT